MAKTSPGALITGALLLLLNVTAAKAANPVVSKLLECPVAELLQVENGRVAVADVDGTPVWRWHIDTGQTSTLAIRPEHPLFDRLRYYDRLQMRYRIASGEISSLKLNALGHVSGPRQYKVHNFRIAIITTPREVWHHEQIDLARPYWFPWDNVDGEGEDGYFRFEAMALTEDTVIEMAAPQLVRGLLFLKPDYEAPYTWPIKAVNDDGSITYTLTYSVLNSSGQPATVTASVVSSHQHFQVALNQSEMAVKAAKIADFTVTATMSPEALQATPALYAEPLRLVFALAHRPEVTDWWQGNLVRPLPDDVRRQVMFSADTVSFIRQRLAEDDEQVKAIVDLAQVIRRADEFVAKTLLTAPQSYSHVRNGYPKPWLPGEAMPEAVNTETGERRFGDPLAGQVWREYLAYSGQASYYDGLAYLLTADERYALKGIELMQVFTQSYRHHKWHNLFDPPFFRGEAIQTSSRSASNSSYGSNWDFKWICKMLSMIADSPSWTAATRDDVYTNWVVPYAAELAKLKAQISNQTDITNHNLLLLGLAFDDATLVHTATLRDCGLVSRLSDIDEDGFSSEGRPLNYHHAAADEYLPSVTHLANSQLSLTYGKERILAALRMPFYRSTLSGVVPNTGDSGRGLWIRANGLADVLAGIAPEAKWLLDAGRDTTIEAKLRRLQDGSEYDADGWRKLLETEPRLFRQAGMAILRSGETVDTQVMATLDFGRNVFHGAQDRNQLTLYAFGKIFTHGPGSLYNAGSGGIKMNTDPRLTSFISGRWSLSHNVIATDQHSQQSCVGKLLTWSAEPDRQLVVSRVDGIAPGVSHTRGLLLTHGILIMLDRVSCEASHSIDFVYHNFGELTIADGWQSTPTEPLGQTGNYDNISAPTRLDGSGVFRATWDLTRQYPYWRESKQAVDESKLPPVHLGFWQLPVAGGQLYSGVTGLNNTNTMIMADETPTIIHRVSGREVQFLTVLEPYQETPQVTAVASQDNTIVVTRLNDTTIRASLTELHGD